MEFKGLLIIIIEKEVSLKIVSYYVKAGLKRTSVSPHPYPPKPRRKDHRNALTCPPEAFFLSANH